MKTANRRHAHHLQVKFDGRRQPTGIRCGHPARLLAFKREPSSIRSRMPCHQFDAPRSCAALHPVRRTNPVMTGSCKRLSQLAEPIKVRRKEPMR